MIGKQNEYFMERVFNQKSIISPQKYDKEFNEMVTRFNTKKYANKKLILPPIHWIKIIIIIDFNYNIYLIFKILLIIYN